MTLNDSEQIVAEEIVRIVDFASRVINAVPGSHYQWDKARELAEQATRLHRRLSHLEEEDGDMVVAGYSKPEQRVDAAAVERYVAKESQHYDLGRRLWPSGKVSSSDQDKE